MGLGITRMQNPDATQYVAATIGEAVNSQTIGPFGGEQKNDSDILKSVFQKYVYIFFI